MTTDSEHTRYRGGYAAGQRDAIDSGEEDESQKRALTGDAWADVGYAHGFDEGKRHLRRQAFADIGMVLKKVFLVPQIAGGVRWTVGTLRGMS